MAMLSSLVGSSKIKSCDLDPVPAHVLKEWLSVQASLFVKYVKYMEYKNNFFIWAKGKALYKGFKGRGTMPER